MESEDEFRERVVRDYGPMYYDRQGKEMTMMEWAKKLEDFDYKIVKQDHVGKYFISTVWLGLNMQFFKGAPKHIFETMIFCEENKDDALHLYQERYSTEQEALEGHKEAASLASIRVRVQESQVVEMRKDSQSEDPVQST